MESQPCYWLETPATWTPTEADYYDSEFVGSSALARFAKDRQAFDRGDEMPVTDAMLRGRVVDCAITEPERLTERYGLKTTAKEEAFAWGYHDTTLVPEVVAKAAMTSVMALCTNSLATALLNGPGLSQVCHHWTHPSGVECRMRLDRAIMTAKGPGFVDLKNWDIDRNRIADEICRRGADRQAALYSQGFKDLWAVEPHVVLVIVPSSGAWVESVPLSAGLLELARLDVDADLYAMAECRRTDDWSNPRDKTLNYAHPPRWRVIESERRHGE